MEISDDDENRFWSKVLTGDVNECWEWMAACCRDGYGQFWYKDKVYYKAHRFSYELKYGKIENGLFVCHKCDNPKCVNPEHLFLGTSAENTKDRNDKGRSAKGEKQHSAKLTEHQVLEIRNKYITGNYTQIQLANEYNVHDTTISKIILKKLWKHI